MKKLIALAALSLVTACAQPQGQMEGMSCKCCKEMMKEGCKCCQGMGGDMMKDGAGCCCKGMMSGSGMDMKDGKGMMCEKMMQDKAASKQSTPKTAPVTNSEHEQHH